MFTSEQYHSENPLGVLIRSNNTAGALRTMNSRTTRSFNGRLTSLVFTGFAGPEGEGAFSTTFAGTCLATGGTTCTGVGAFCAVPRVAFADVVPTAPDEGAIDPAWEDPFFATTCLGAGPAPFLATVDGVGRTAEGLGFTAVLPATLVGVPFDGAADDPDLVAGRGLAMTFFFGPVRALTVVAFLMAGFFTADRLTGTLGLVLAALPVDPGPPLTGFAVFAPFLAGAPFPAGPLATGLVLLAAVFTGFFATTFFVDARVLAVLALTLAGAGFRVPVAFDPPAALALLVEELRGALRFLAMVRIGAGSG